jgi:asparagine synthase (glutamine-hydrolysing)
MCGIAAAYGAYSAGEAERMLDQLVHRGPDDEGEVRVGSAWLGHRRLSIVDVDGGHQPLHSRDDRVKLVGNGEVYNFDRIRRRLIDQDMLTRSDNEVALHLFREQGPEAFGELHGMWAFAIATEDGRFVAARDPVGIKPLYWTPPTDEDDAVRFASEMRAFDEAWQPRVESFPPGHFWTPETGLTRFAAPVPDEPTEPWAEPEDPDAPPPPAAMVAVRERLIETVERQLMGDVPVGVFLSGGLDSTLVAAIAARRLRREGQHLQTFAVGLEHSPDLLAARQAAAALGTLHRERIYTAQEALDVLPTVVATIESYDPSLVRSAVANYLLAEMTSRHVKVVLTGEGADEIFAGYEYLRDFETQADLHQELVRTVEGLHDLNLQRADRVTMAHGLEARVPFLELDMIDLGLALPAAWKIARPGVPEKRLLREAFQGWLPPDLLWREKSQFGDGSGASSVLREHMEQSVTEEEFEAERNAVEPALRSREELAYHRIFARHLGGVRPELTIGRFATT